MTRRLPKLGWILTSSFALSMCVAGCSPVRVPRIDPSGQRIFLPSEQTTTVVPLTESAPLIAGLPNPAFVRPEVPPPCPELVQPPCGIAGPPVAPNSGISRSRDVVRDGAIVLNPTKVIAPINSDVVIFGGLCGADGYFRKRQRLEWSLSQESVGHFVEVREGSLRRLREVFGSDTGKQGINYAVGYTSSAQEAITRGTPTVIDDLIVHSGQGWVSVTSPSEGTSHVTCMAPKAEGWDRRRQTATVHWIDALWEFPPSVVVAAGSAHNLETIVRRATTQEAIEGWEVSYTVLPGGVPAGFAPAGSTTAQNLRTNATGIAGTTLRQPIGQAGPGLTQVRVDIVRPAAFAGDPDRLQIASGVVTIRWTSPAITMVASGPETVGIDTPFTYRLEITNPGDQIASGVTVNAMLPPDLTLISSNPDAVLAGGTLSWNLGDVAPGQAPWVIEIAAKANRRGTVRPCFQVVSADTRLSMLERCLETTVAAPCLFLQVDGPSEAQVGDEVTYRIRIQNQCDERLTNVTLTDTYGDGLVVEGIPSPLVYESFDLEPGQTSADIDLTFQVRQPGTQCHLIQVTTDGGHSAESRQCVEATDVERPDLDVSVVATDLAGVGDRFIARATITNTGNTVLPELTILNEYSASMRPITATDGWEVVDRGLQWRLRPMRPQEQVVLEVDLNCLAPDAAAVVRFVAASADGFQREGLTRLRIEGEPVQDPIQDPIRDQNPTGPPDDNIRIEDPVTSNRLVIGITSFDEPVNPGDEVNYQVRVTNDRNISDTNVVIQLIIPDGMTYVGGRADDLLQAESRSQDGRTITMQTRRELRAGEGLSFRAIVRAETPGIKTFSVVASSGREPDGTSDSIDTTVNRR